MGFGMMAILGRIVSIVLAAAMAGESPSTPRAASSRTQPAVSTQGRPVVGKVVDERGRPVAEAAVDVVLDREGLCGQITRTNAAGEFRLAGIKPGPVSLRVEKPGFARTTITIDVKEPPELVRVVLRRGGIVDIVVRDAVTGKPIHGADLNIQRVVGGEWFQGRTDGRGVARLHLAPGEYTLTRLFKFGSYRTHPTVERIAVTADRPVRVQIALAPLPVLRGRVVDARGRAVPAAEVRVRGPGYRPVQADGDGRFALAWDPTDEPGGGPPSGVLVATGEARNLAAAMILTSRPEQIEVKLRPGATIRGRVVDELDRPIARAKVIPRLLANGRAWSFTDQAVTTDARGEYQVCPVPTGWKYALTATADGFGEAEAVFDVDAAGRRVVDVPRIRLKAANLSLGGVVLDAAGKGILGVQVVTRGPGQRINQTLTDARGRFQVKNICRGKVTLEARLPAQGLEARVEAEGGDNALRVVLSGTAK